MSRALARSVVAFTATAGAAFSLALGRTLAALSDGSLKIGIQGWDSNRWRLPEILPVIAALDELAVLVRRETGALLAPVDVWGGGQVSQPPRFLGEDPFENLARMKEVGPNLRMKCIYRGRQAFGFLPCADEIQRAALGEAAAAGVQVFRIFDPLGDNRNLTTAIETVNGLRARQIAAGVPEDELVSLEGLVYHVRPPAGGTAIWDERQTLASAIELARAGCHEIGLSDYAGQLTSAEEIARAVGALRQGLDAAGLRHIPVGFFGVGGTPEMMVAALRAGAHMVDVSLGVMAGGISSADMRTVAEILMREQGFDMSAAPWRDHPVWRQLLRVEAVLDDIARIHLPYRVPVKPADVARMSRSRLAFNAVSALQSAVGRSFASVIAPSLARGAPTGAEPPSQAAYIDEVLEECERLWVRAGQPHMVSPFGFMLSFQAEILVRTRREGRRPGLASWRADFRAIMLGRFGRNLGVERGACDQGLLRAFRIFGALEVLIAARLRLAPAAVDAFLADAGLGLLVRADALSAAARDPIIEEHLREAADLDRFARAVRRCQLGSELVAEMERAMALGPAPAPTEDLAGGRALVEELESEGLAFGTTPAGPGRLSDRERAALLLVLFKVAESDPYKIGKHLHRYLQDPARAPGGDIEPDLRPVDALLGPAIARLAEIEAKARILRAAGARPLAARVRERNDAGLRLLAERRRALLLDAERVLRGHGFTDAHVVPALRVERGLRVLAALAGAAAPAAEARLARVEPATWRDAA